MKKHTVISMALFFLFAFGLGRPAFAAEPSARKVLFYRNPMNPQVTSPVPMKDSMGMDYVPVYASDEETAGKTEETGVRISPQKQQLVDIKTTKVAQRDLQQQIKTVGTVAYDPGLYAAQQEYLQALTAQDKLKDSTIDVVKEQAASLVDASAKKLVLMGMTQKEIDALAQAGEPQENLYLPTKDENVWVYATVYEDELDLVKEGLAVEVTARAYPSEIFKGEVVAIKPVLDAATRSAQARIEVENKDNKLKPEMYVDVTATIDLGEKLAIPEEAVIDTGARKVVFLAGPDGYFQQRDVTLGRRAQGYYEVLSGLKEGDEVVSSGSFFVDSESRLKQ